MSIDITTLALAKEYTNRMVGSGGTGNGVDGGYYTPGVTQPTTDTMQISFAPSKLDMPVVDPVTVNLPVSENSGQTLTLDNTLTQSGQAADAKTTGDEIRRVEGLIPSIEGLAKTKDVPTKPEDIGAQPAGHYLTEAPVKSVNGKTGDVEFNASDVEGVAYIAQELTEEQQTQARHNIGAVSMEEVEELLGIEEEFSVTGEVVEFNLDVEPGTELEIISKIHRDETWGESNKLVLHQVSGSNFVDMASFLGGVGQVFEQNGLTATVNADSTVTIRGTNESTSRTTIINQYHWSGEHSAKVYPAGTYTIPRGFTMAVRAAQYPKNVAITGIGNLSNTVTIPEPFRIIMLQYGVSAGNTIDVTLPLGLFRGETVPETEYEYSGVLHTVTFDRSVYEGEFNWKTGELKDANGDTIAYYGPHEIASLPGTNYFWTCFGENTVSNASNDLGKVILRLNEPAPEDAIASICDFMLTPSTPKATYCLHSAKVRNGGAFFKHEIPLVTTKGKLAISDSRGEILTEKYVDSLINWEGVSDTFTNKGIRKAWSDRFYFTKEPVAQEEFAYDGGITNALYTFEFTEEDFQNTGIPAKLDNIPIVSPCFYTRTDAVDKLNSRLFGGDVFPATFSWDDETGKYIFKVRGLYPEYIMDQLQHYTKAYFCYQLATPYDIPATLAMCISSCDTVTFAADDSDWATYIDGDLYVEDSIDVTPTCSIFVPRNPVDACEGMMNAARMLNTSGTVSGDVTVQGYSWIGAGDGVTDYTAKIQNKLDVLHTTSGGGTIHLGPGTYPISNSLIVYGNTKIIGDGHTIIEQRADNTHAVIWNGSQIRMQDLTIKLAGKCTEITACIYANSHNVPGGSRDERYPENASVQFCATDNVTLTGTYTFAWDEGYVYLPDDVLTYRGVGVCSHSMYFNYHDASRVVCRHLYAGVYNGGSANNYRMYVTDSRYAVYGGGTNNIFEISGHSYYGYGRDGERVVGTDYAYYGTDSDNNMITIEFYDAQYAKGIIFFEGKCQNNHYRMAPSTTGQSTGISYHWDDQGFNSVTDYGRGNIRIQPYRERFVGIGSYLPSLSGLPYWNTQFNPSVHNALSGAGVWGSMTSNIEWTSLGNISLQDICRYPKETGKTYLGLASVISSRSPSEESPVEIIIDIRDRPVSNYHGFWIQFDHRYVAEEYTVSFDTANDGTFDLVAASIRGNIDPVSYRFNYQKAAQMVYRIKITITKALQIPEFLYSDADYTEHTINYNPDGLIGIVNIGMPSNEAYGRAFLGECGGSLYGNVDMHQCTLKNLPAPVDDGDAVSKSYLEEKAADAKAVGDALDKLEEKIPSIEGLAKSEEIPTKVSQLDNDKGYLIQHQDISGKADKAGLTLGIHTDGLIYLFVDNKPVGTGIELSAGGISGYIDSANNIVINGLPDGSYAVKYEMADGSTIDIGDLVLDSNVYYSVTNTLTNCINSNSATEIVSGESYEAVIAPNSGYELKSVTVTMGGSPVTVSGGAINIASVTGNIVITAVAEEKAVAPVYKNWLPLAVDADGNPYNGGKGYKAGYKMSGNSGNESATTGAYCSGFIPIEDIEHYVYIKNIALHSGANVNNIIFYNKDKTKLYSASGSTAGSFHTSVKDIGDGVYRFRAFLWINEEQGANLGFFRFSCGGISDDTIVTVNEEIV